MADTWRIHGGFMRMGLQKFIRGAKGAVTYEVNKKKEKIRFVIYIEKDFFFNCDVIVKQNLKKRPANHYSAQYRQKDLEESSQIEESIRQRAAEAESTCQELRKALEEENVIAHALREVSRESVLCFVYWYSIQ